MTEEEGEDEAVITEDFYTDERWNNWMERIDEEDFDPESGDEDDALLFFKLQDDITIACANAVEAHDEGHIDEDKFFDEVAKIRDVVMSDVSLNDDDKEMMVEGVQTSLVGVLASCETYVANGPQENDVEAEEFVLEAIEAEAEDDVDRALGLVSEAGAKILDGDDFDAESVADEVEYGYVSEWINGLDSLEDAVTEPETVDED
ncbi:MAG: DUF2150 family protein [Halobacteria archaeon]|nr:DUF2150 family protein [Halobacteria archaeon]